MTQSQRFFTPIWVGALVMFAGVAGLAQQPGTPAVTPAAGPSFVLTVLDKKGHAVTDVAAANVIVAAGKSALPVKAVLPLQGNDARMELYIVFDDDIANFAPYMSQVRNFVNSLPPTTVVGVAYLRTGTAVIGIPLTLNHAGASEAMRPPAGQAGVSQSPFESISALIKGWPQRPNRRREMVVFSEGVEGFAENNSDNPLVRDAITAAQTAGIVVYAIATSGSGTSTAAPKGSRTGAALGGTMNDSSPALDANVGQGHLADLALKTGGDIYAQGTTTPQNMQDMFADILTKMQSQFRVLLDAPAGAAPGLVPVKVELRQANVKINAPAAVLMP